MQQRITSHKKRRATYKSEMLMHVLQNSNSGEEVKLLLKFPAKRNTLTVDTNDQTFNCDNADGHSKTGNRKKVM